MGLKHYKNHYKVGDIQRGVSPIWVNFHEVSLHHDWYVIETCDYTSR